VINSKSAGSMPLMVDSNDFLWEGQVWRTSNANIAEGAWAKSSIML